MTHDFPAQLPSYWISDPVRRLMQIVAAALIFLTLGVSNDTRAADATFTDAELDQMLAPIALYPDSLLSQVLMASTYPADVKEAVAWSKQHPDDKGDSAVEKIKDKAWDPSVQSLVAFPQLLVMMGEKPDQIQKIGDAFLADSGRVMDRVQFLRKKAQDAGNLKTTEQQKVSTTVEEGKQVIIVEPAQPEQVYVPVYQPSVVYGPWWYPSYPPYYWAPPPYYYPGGAFVRGVVWGAAVVGIANGLWGGCNWGRGDVNINVNKYNNINVNNKISNGNFTHNSERRGDVPYRDSKSRDQYGKKPLDGAKDRENFRGKDGALDQERAKAADTLKSRGADPAAGRERLQGADRDAASRAVNDRSAGGGSRDFGGGGNRDFGGGGHDSAFSGARDNSRAGAADRGRASTNSMRERSGGGGGAHFGGGGGGGGRMGGGGGGRRR
ncbi:DUF3300 domain-containing protein [Uliginosibacterium sp. H3]|uniref:DUF3300 domain-containing protein n=1 Tax=Uliginosibacterium silvisoli TaxID=3114758 RepID=A0ABU6K8G7_9RHOO|nr:DUF3300 domain-containing protein [Uliginosibacterium sp. H3]